MRDEGEMGRPPAQRSVLPRRAERRGVDRAVTMRKDNPQHRQARREAYHSELRRRSGTRSDCSLGRALSRRTLCGVKNAEGSAWLGGCVSISAIISAEVTGVQLGSEEDEECLPPGQSSPHHDHLRRAGM